MSNEVTVSIEGIPELQKTLNEMVKVLGPERVEPVLLKGAKTIQGSVKEKAPKGKTGNLIKDIKVKQLPKIGDSPKSAIVKSTSPADHLVEFGTKPRRQKNGRYTGSMPAKPFFRPAVDANKEPVLRQIAEDLKAQVDEVM